jgi:replicative DNA helicase Mcm
MINDHVYLSSPASWKDFFYRYYKDDIRREVVQGSPSVKVDYRNIQKFSVYIAQELINEPDKILSHAYEGLALVDIPLAKKIDLHLRIVGFPKHVMIRNVRNENVNRVVSVEATVQNISTVHDRCLEAAFECATCKSVKILPQEAIGKFIEPTYCSCNEEKKGVFRLLERESKFDDYQKLRLQESPEDLRGDEQPRTIDVNVSDDIADFVHPGERVVVNGILRHGQRIKNNTKTVFFDHYIDAISIEREEIAYEDLEITPIDVEAIKKLAYGPDPVLKVASSIAPWIHGLDDVKMGITGQLFGGVKKPLPDGAQIRGDIHQLWVGDPGVAKSQVLGDVAKIAPRGMYSSGLGVSGAGLTAATVRDDFMGDGSFSLRAGVLALMNGGGIACIDEFGRMREEDREKMHTAMEQQKIPIDRAGFHTTLKSECSVLAAGNPVDGRWDDFDNPAEQIGLDPALLSRFDLVYVTRDIAETERDTIICKHILSTNRAGELLANGQDPGADGKKTLERPIPLDILKKWVAYARRTIKPVMTDEARMILENYYLEIRGRNSNQNIIHATARQLEGPIRLSEAYARIRLSPIVEQKDAQMAINVIRESWKGLTDPSTGKQDIDTMNVGRGQAQQDRINTLLKIIEDTAKEYGGKASIELVRLRAQEHGLKEMTTNKLVKHLKESGDVWEPEADYLARSKN